MSPESPKSEVRVAPDSVEMLQALYESDLRHRRIFVPGLFSLRNREQCSLVIEHPTGTSLTVAAEAVYVKTDEPGAGVGLELIGLDAAMLTQLESFVRQPGAEYPGAEKGPRNIHERVRQLSLREREIVGRTGVISDRVALERAFGGSVWESLLQNPQLTAPEVARIAKNGTLPIPLVAIIVANGSWLASSEVRRALLGNPRVSGAHLDRALKATPMVELRQISQMSAYRSQVRLAAKKLLGEA